MVLQYDDNSLMFIDKHAAHEALIYKQLKEMGELLKNLLVRAIKNASFYLALIYVYYK